MTDLEIYYENLQKPWGKLFYRMLWEQLSFAKSLHILDFGSGFGLTANHLASHNQVIAIEPNQQMCEMRFQENNYCQIIGRIEALNKYPDESFDLILCHNVLEYVDEKDDYISTFRRLLKADGKLSLVKHNPLGRIMQKAVFENDPAQALQLLNGERGVAKYFGEIRHYGSKEFGKWQNLFGLKQLESYGIRAFYALHPDNSIRYDEEWVESIFQLEMKASTVEEFRNIAFFHHVILRLT